MTYVVTRTIVHEIRVDADVPHERFKQLCHERFYEDVFDSPWRSTEIDRSYCAWTQSEPVHPDRPQYPVTIKHDDSEYW